MPTFLTIAYLTEGPTDQRFLAPVIQRTFDQLVREANFSIDVEALIYICKSTVAAATSFKELIEGYDIVCIHVDADKQPLKEVNDTRYIPVVDALNTVASKTKFVPVIPVRMTEAWMLADETLLKEELQTSKSYSELGISKEIEAIADPKKIIVKAIKIADQSRTKKQRNQLVIGNLYEPFGQEVNLTQLERFPSYQKFKEAARQALIQANLLQP